MQESVLRRWLKEYGSRPAGKAADRPVKNAQTQEIERLKRELARVKMERDIIKKRSATSRKTHREVRLHCPAPYGVAGQGDVPGDDCPSHWVLRLGGAFAQPAEALRQWEDYKKYFDVLQPTPPRGKLDMWPRYTGARSS